MVVQFQMQMLVELVGVVVVVMDGMRMVQVQELTLEDLLIMLEQMEQVMLVVLVLIIFHQVFYVVVVVLGVVLMW